MRGNLLKRPIMNQNIPKHSEIYEQMMPRFNSFCEELEKTAQKFPNLCEGLSSIERLPVG